MGKCISPEKAFSQLAEQFACVLHFFWAASHLTNVARCVCSLISTFKWMCAKMTNCRSATNLEESTKNNSPTHRPFSKVVGIPCHLAARKRWHTFLIVAFFFLYFFYSLTAVHFRDALRPQTNRKINLIASFFLLVFAALSTFTHLNWSADCMTQNGGGTCHRDACN